MKMSRKMARSALVLAGTTLFALATPTSAQAAPGVDPCSGLGGLICQVIGPPELTEDIDLTKQNPGLLMDETMWVDPCAGQGCA